MLTVCIQVPTPACSCVHVCPPQIQQVFNERDILTWNDQNPFVVGLWCTFQTKVLNAREEEEERDEEGEEEG